MTVQSGSDGSSREATREHHYPDTAGSHSLHLTILAPGKAPLVHRWDGDALHRQVDLLSQIVGFHAEGERYEELAGLLNALDDIAEYAHERTDADDPLPQVRPSEMGARDDRRAP
jgi:hypothetical protein